VDGTVVVGISAVDQDKAALAWAADQAWHGRDALYVVHAYRALVSSDRYWPLLVRANDARRGAAQHVVASAIQLARAARPGLSVDGSSIAGSVTSVLLDVAHVAELLVLGRYPGTTPAEIRDLGAGSVCPVVFVGARPRTAGPVVLLLDGGLPAGGSPAAVDFAFAAAEQRDCGLVVVQAGLPARPGVDGSAAAILAAQTQCQEQLDVALADWHERFPNVGVTAQLRREPVADCLHWGVTAGRLVVLATGWTDAVVALECLPDQAAVAVVPATARHAAWHDRLAKAPALV
jgi:hypothetical protein